MYYNADWLKQLGYNEPPKDWKTWEEAACKASDPAPDKYGWAFRHDASNFASQVFAPRRPHPGAGRLGLRLQQRRPASRRRR